MEKKSSIKLALTAEQREQIKHALGKEVAELELSLEALEERVAPGMAGSAVPSCMCRTK